jgi:hypothetical protein
MNTIVENLTASFLPSVSEGVLVIPSDYFYCPYWFLNAGGILIFIIGLIIGFGSVYGWKKLFFRILVFANRIR